MSGLDEYCEAINPLDSPQSPKPGGHPPYNFSYQQGETQGPSISILGDGPIP